MTDAYSRVCSPESASGGFNAGVVMPREFETVGQDVEPPVATRSDSVVRFPVEQEFDACSLCSASEDRV